MGNDGERRGGNMDGEKTDGGKEAHCAYVCVSVCVCGWMWVCACLSKSSVLQPQNLSCAPSLGGTDSF